jgi:O-acetyl-ADP-ribose deacetylase (regulator of RNase III)
MPAAVADGNLLDAPDQFIAHQCNCVTGHAAGLAAALFSRFPHADVYSGRAAHDVPGTIRVRGGDGTADRPVIAIFGQVYPGKPRYPNSETDGADARERHFAAALGLIAGIPGITSVAFPWEIGCGMAGGNWTRYRAIIDRFADSNPGIRATVYRLGKP